MRASFDEIAGKGLARRDEIYPLIASLIRAERTHRQARSISYRIGGAKFPVLKDLDKFVFADTSVDEEQVRVQFLEAVSSLKSRAALTTAYAAVCAVTRVAKTRNDKGLCVEPFVDCCRPDADVG